VSSRERRGVSTGATEARAYFKANGPAGGPEGLPEVGRSVWEQRRLGGKGLECYGPSEDPQ